jgi:hypothetical protein
MSNCFCSGNHDIGLNGRTFKSVTMDVLLELLGRTNELIATQACPPSSYAQRRHGKLSRPAPLGGAWPSRRRRPPPCRSVRSAHLSIAPLRRHRSCGASPRDPPYRLRPLEVMSIWISSSGRRRRPRQVNPRSRLGRSRRCLRRPLLRLLLVLVLPWWKVRELRALTPPPPSMRRQGLSSVASSLSKIFKDPSPMPGRLLKPRYRRPGSSSGHVAARAARLCPGLH